MPLLRAQHGAGVDARRWRLPGVRGPSEWRGPLASRLEIIPPRVDLRQLTLQFFRPIKRRLDLICGFFVKLRRRNLFAEGPLLRFEGLDARGQRLELPLFLEGELLQGLRVR